MKLLLIEDEVALAALIKRGLQDEGYAVDVIADGEEGLNQLLMSHEDYSLAIIDRMLPGKDGLSICRELREARVNLPVIILTALGSNRERINGLDSGADDYIVKPFVFDELLARIRAVLRRPAALRDRVLKTTGLTLDTVRRKVWVNKKEVELTTKEFAILELLMLHPGQVFDREQLTNRLWDFNFDSFSNVIDVHIKNLRKKLGDGKSQSVIETVRGIGYSLKG